MADHGQSRATRRVSSKANKSAKNVTGACTIPPALKYDVLAGLILNRNPHGEAAIRSYMEWQASDEVVQHLEKVATEPLLGGKCDAWSVHTDKGNWWVLTPYTNLYSQELFPSLDYTITFHTGIVARIASRREPGVPQFEKQPLASAWRKWEQAGVALDEADEPEEFQAVGLRCRESLIAMVKTMCSADMVAAGSEAPKRSDVVRWAELIANHVAHGASAEHVRGHLKAVAKGCWQLVGWLTHAQNATRHDAELAIESTQHVLVAFGRAQLRSKLGPQQKCPQCGSLRLSVREPPDSTDGSSPVLSCQVCGWANSA